MPDLGRRNSLLIVSAGLAVLVIGAVRLGTPHPAARSALDVYLAPEPYTLLSVQLAPQPENFTGVCSLLDDAALTDLWCVQVSAGSQPFTHYILHESAPRWAVIPVWDFDPGWFEAIGCRNW